MDDIEVFGRLALAFGLGLVIGIERGWHTREVEKGTRALGVRTFALIGLLGGALGLVGQLTRDLVIAFGLLGFLAMVTAIYVTGLSRIQDRGATTEVAAILTFVLGIVAVRGDMAVAAAAAVMVTAILDLKEPLHRWIKALDDAELSAAIKLLVISVVILPVMPNRALGPGGVLNPYLLWWIVVVIGLISFAAYAAIRMLGAKLGVVAVGALGGLASSTATTLTFARLAAKSPSLTRVCAGGTAVASAVMFARALILVSVFHSAAFRILAFPMVAASFTALLAGISLSQFKTDLDPAKEISLGSPTDIGTGIKFVLATIAIAMATYYGQQALGPFGAYAASAAGGLVDIDATTVTMARLGAGGAAPLSEVVSAIYIGIAVNTAAKVTYGTVIAGRQFARLVAPALAAPLLVAATVQGVLTPPG